MRADTGEGLAVRPWATWALLATTGLAALATTGSSQAAWHYGIVPAAPRLLALGAHPFVHAGWLHALGTLSFVALAGPWLEARLGRGLFVAGYLAAALLGAALFVATHPGDGTPWTGGSAAVAGLLGALLTGVGRGRVDLAAVAAGRLPAFRVPGWALAAVWVGRELAGLAGDGSSAWVAHAGSFAFGAALAFALRRSGVIEVPACEPPESSVAASRREALASAPALPEDPVRREALLGEAADPGLALAYVGDSSDPAAARSVVAARLWDAIEWRRREPAMALWRALVETGPAPAGAVEPVLQLASWLRGAGYLAESVLALHAALASGEPGAAGRVARAARRVDPVVCFRAAEAALLDTGLGPSDRKALEGLRLEAEREAVARGVILVPRDRVASAPRPRRAPPGTRRALPAPGVEPVRKLADGEAIELGPEEPLELAPESAPAPLALPDPEEAGEPAFLSAFHRALEANGEGAARKEAVPLPPRAVRVREALPRTLESDALLLDVPGHKPIRLSFRRLHGVALAGVRGLSERVGDKPVLIVDLLLSPEAEAELHVLRLRSDRFDPRRLSIVPEASPLKALRGFVAALATAAHAPLLPVPEVAGDAPLRVYRDLASYQRDVLHATD